MLTLLTDYGVLARQSKKNFEQILTHLNALSVVKNYTVFVDALLNKDLIINAGVSIKMQASNKTIYLPNVVSTDNGLRGIVYNHIDSLSSFLLASNDGYLINGQSSIVLDIDEYAIVYYKHDTTEWLLLEE